MKSTSGRQQKYDEDEAKCYPIFDGKFSRWLKWFMLHTEQEKETLVRLEKKYNGQIFF